MSIWGGVGSLFGIESGERAKAEALRKQALEQAQNQSELTKQMYLDNSEAIGDLGSSLFGEDPEVVAQRYADQRAQMAASGGANAATPSGRTGHFDFGSGGGAPAPTAAGASGGDAGFGASGLPPVPANYAAMSPQEKLQWSVQNGYVQQDPNSGEFVPTAAAQQVNQNAAQSANAPRSAATGATPKGTISASDRDRAARAVQANYSNTLPGQLDASLGRRQGAVDSFVNDLNGIKAVDAGNYDNAWNVDANRQYLTPESKAAQQTAMNKTLALTDTKETAEEKLMREISRRNQERDLRAQSEAQANQLKARGAYGSGAELAGFLGSQQELAQRRSLEELGANANAQKRAVDAIGQYGNLAMQQGAQDLQQGAQQDMNSRFNSQSQQQFNQFKTKTQQQENDAAAKRAASKTDAQLGVENTKRADINSIADRKTQLTGMKTGNNTNMVGAAGQAASNLASSYKSAAASADAKGDKDEDLLGGIL